MWETITYFNVDCNQWVAHNIDFDLWAMHSKRNQCLKEICELIRLQIFYAKTYDCWQYLEYTED